jgi:hypothetical protein
MESLKKPLLALCPVVLVSAALVAGCGGSDQPEYCDKVDTLKDSISQLTSIDIDAGVIDTVKSDLETVESNAEAAVDAAKDDFPSESSDLEDAVNTASDSIQDLPSSPSASEIAAVALNVGAVANAAESFEETTSSACS